MRYFKSFPRLSPFLTLLLACALHRINERLKFQRNFVDNYFISFQIRLLVFIRFYQHLNLRGSIKHIYMYILLARE
jgi:hypothetical protein